METVEKRREASVENKFVRSILYGMALNLKGEEIENILKMGVSRVDEMTEEDREKLLRQVPKVVKLFGHNVGETVVSPKEDDFGVDPSDAEYLKVSEVTQRLIEERYLPSIKEGPPKFFGRKYGKYFIVLTGQFHTKDGEYSLNGSVAGSRNISHTDPERMLCQGGKKVSVIVEKKDYGVYKSLIVWGWALKLEDGVKCRFWINKRGDTRAQDRDIASVRIALAPSHELGFVKS